MSPEQETLLLIKGTISELTVEQQQQVKDCATAIRAVMADAGPAAGVMAVVLVAAELEARA